MGDKPFLGLVAPFVPAVGWIRAYEAKEFPRDLVAGLSLAAFVIPESLAYASLAQLPPVSGLYCYLVAGIAYAIFGTSRQLAVGPTSALAITIATSVVAMGGDDLSRVVTLASALALIVGMVCIAGRIVGLANVAYFISDAILIGFKTGAALYIASTQLPTLFGIEGISGNVFPVAGGMSQTDVNDMGGASSPFSLLVTSGAIALTLVFFARLFHNLPEPVLAAVVLMAASHMVRLDDLRQLRFSSRAEFRIALVALFGVLFLGLLDGLLLAAAGSLIMVVAHASRPPVVILGREPISGHFVNRTRHPEATEAPGALVIRSAGAWFYFNAENIRRRIFDLLSQAPSGIKTVVIDFSLVPTVDVTAAGVLRGLARSLEARDIVIVLAELRDDVRENLTAVGAEQDLGPVPAHRTIEDCLRHGRSRQY